ncbi:hypothetical protein [Leptolyngbya sp. FACHB-541]|uniref:hypothetical protein n=1 Tax=Leptolyngbya sp. FACHB-541 TaxID=2692810 RepID=UPI001683D760|nr:hypothetical protein [Leptolyngbya sp. FACHB-541]
MVTFHSTATTKIFLHLLADLATSSLISSWELLRLTHTVEERVHLVQSQLTIKISGGRQLYKLHQNLLAAFVNPLGRVLGL